MKFKSSVEEREGTGFPGKTFARNILKPVFDVQKKYYYKHFIELSKAHAVMLLEQGIITKTEAAAILGALTESAAKDYSSVEYNPLYEDMFFTIEKEIEGKIGIDMAGRLHIARSRNDICMCEQRMVIRVKLLELLMTCHDFMDVLFGLAEENTATIMPAYTHTQPAQPTTLAHYLLAFYDEMNRSVDRLLAAYDNTNLSVLGAAAITTTGFPISRERVCELLGFTGLVENSYDCIAGVDYLTQSAGAIMILAVDLSRFMKDVLDNCTKEFNVFRLSDAYVQKSSIMPQKRNPSALEHTRPILSKALAEARCVFDVLHSTPFGDMVDSEEDLQCHLYDSIEYCVKALEVITVVFSTMEINKDILMRRANEGFIAVTELADMLVREKNLNFRTSHGIAAGIVRYMLERSIDQDGLTTDIVREVARNATNQEIDISAEMIQKALDPVNFVAVRSIVGGPAEIEVRRMLEFRSKNDKRSKTQQHMEGISAASETLNRCIEEIISG